MASRSRRLAAQLTRNRHSQDLASGGRSDPEALGGSHRVRACLDPELAHDVLDVGTHSLGGEDEDVGDVIGRVAAREQLDDLPLPGGQWTVDGPQA